MSQHTLRCVAFAFVMGSLLAQTTLLVPASYPTIQAAIAASTPGDTVLVSPGTYIETIDFLGKAITVRGANGAAATILDGNQTGPVVSFVTGETPASVLEGFTIQNGLGVVVAGVFSRSTAGGIQCVDASPTIRRCVVTNNRGGPGAIAASAGQFVGLGGPGGLLASNSALRLSDCAFVGNIGGQGGNSLVAGPFGSVAGRGGAGGANFSWTVVGSTPQLLRCRFDGNRGGDGGLAIGSGATAAGGRGGDGGVELLLNTLASLLLCEFRRNDGGNGGGASGTGSLIAGSGGHGAFDLTGPILSLQNLVLANCIVVDNRGGNAGVGPNGLPGNGGGATGTLTFTALASTIAGNLSGTPTVAGAGVGGLTLGGFMTSQATLRNCIAWGNLRGGQPSDLQIPGIVATIQTSDLGAVSGSVIGSGNLSVDPLFRNLAAGDVHLTAASPCRHAGNDGPGLPLFDLDGDARIVGPAIDIGADEWDGLVGSREDFVLDLAVNGTFAPTVITSTAPAGSVVTVGMRSPSGTFANDFVVLGLEPFVPPTTPVGPPALPAIHLGAGAFVFLTFGSGIGTGGIMLPATMPPALSGLGLRVQAFALTSHAQNGLFAATAARDVLL